MIQGAPGPRFRVSGTAGAYVVGERGELDGQEDMLRAGRTPATEGAAWGVEPRWRWGELRRGGSGEVVPSERGAWDTFYPAFAAAVRGSGPAPVDPWEAVAALRVLDAAVVSSAEAHVVALSD